jgi:hypothetical protein
MEREINPAGETGQGAEQAQRRIADEEALAEPFEHGVDVEWYAVLGED